MREVINYSTHIHLLNTIKFILTQTLENFARRRSEERRVGKECDTGCRSRMCLMLQGIMPQVLVLKPYKSIQEISEEVLDFKTRQLA